MISNSTSKEQIWTKWSFARVSIFKIEANSVINFAGVGILAIFTIFSEELTGCKAHLPKIDPRK
jgi:hypothetical protein